MSMPRVGTRFTTTRLDTALQAETPEGITLELRAAGLHARACAWLLDLLIRTALIYVVALASSLFGVLSGSLWLICLFALEWLYPVAFELSKLGATPGKRALGLRVLMDDGLPVTPAASLTRNLLRAADLLPMGYASGALCMLWRSDFKRLGDVVAGTLVVHAPRASKAPQRPGIEPRAPSIPLSMQAQGALIALAVRAERLTPQRVAEIAALAAPLCGPGESADPQAQTRRVLGVGQWLMGRRAS
ncbi:MAG: RDD family protein [Steroidobacteraceae bacterium]